MSTDLTSLLKKMGHDVDKPLTVEHADGTVVTLPTLRELVADQEQAITEAKKAGLW